MMAHVFLSDGGPEASEYSNNYFMFNESDPRALDRLLKALSGKTHADFEVRLLVDSICKSSFSDNKNIKLIPGILFGWLKGLSKKSTTSKI